MTLELETFTLSFLAQNQAGGNLGNLRSRAFSITGNLDAAASKVGATMCNASFSLLESLCSNLV